MKRILFTLIACIAIHPFLATGQGENVKSGIIFYICKNLEMPASKGEGDFIITVIGESDLIPHLEKIASSKKVGDRTIVVKQMTEIREDMPESHVLFLPDESSQLFVKAKYLAEQNNMLLITEKDGLASRGAAVNLILADGKVQYEINPTSLERADLRISNKILALARN